MYIRFLSFFLLYFYSRSIDRVRQGSGRLLSDLHVSSLRFLLGLGDRPALSLPSPLQSRVCSQFLNPSENPGPNTQIFFPLSCKLLLPAGQVVEAECYNPDNSLDFHFMFS